jgi:hypothetical protein
MLTPWQHLLQPFRSCFVTPFTLYFIKIFLKKLFIFLKIYYFNIFSSKKHSKKPVNHKLYILKYFLRISCINKKIKIYFFNYKNILKNTMHHVTEQKILPNLKCNVLYPWSGIIALLAASHFQKKPNLCLTCAPNPISFKFKYLIILYKIREIVQETSFNFYVYFFLFSITRH